MSSVRARNIASRARITASWACLLGRAMFYRCQQFHIGTGKPCQLARIGWIVLGIAAGDPLQFSRVGHDNLMTQPLQFPADPGRLCAGFQGNPPRFSAEMRFNGTHLVAKTAFLHHRAALVHDAVTAHLVAQIDSDCFHRYLLPGLAMLLHGWFLLCTSQSAFHSLTAVQGEPAVSSHLPRDGRARCRVVSKAQCATN
jgi:hypothetical protein